MSLFTLEHGPIDAPSVLFLHGAGVSSWMWNDTMRALPQLHGLAPDLPGLGKNSSVGPFEVTRAARLLTTFIEERAMDGRAHVVGHSLGGAVAAQLTAVAPHVVRSVTLIGVTAQPLKFERLLVAATLALGPLMRHAKVIDAQAKALGVPFEARAQFEADQRALTGDVLKAVMREGARFCVPDELRRVNVPVLALVGAREAAVNRTSAVELVRGMRRGRALSVPGGGHAWLARQPDLLVRTLVSFWADDALPDELVSLPVKAKRPHTNREWTKD
ncbi:alpha/beta fold hydrolase [Deinococcus yavapaiensis]|uniref:Pimeloyl-ACP methyl ester carboxylesterase n=1 Tax=Deinococcus yavapaiensis KR-236 TaxID=694435 RepID=A0A318S0Y8_9DEIO|nr:alpha/beta hydrolase [Deinococcus yavapaiensis]PYE50985.1 pimeloyl-ACP methyl ester carboxylesterase [Deinococcus yavapaiensis KR-236]